MRHQHGEAERVAVICFDLADLLAHEFRDPLTQMFLKERRRIQSFKQVLGDLLARDSGRQILALEFRLGRRGAELDDLNVLKVGLLQIVHGVAFVISTDAREFSALGRVARVARKVVRGEPAFGVFEQVGIAAEIHFLVARLDQDDGVATL